MAGHGTIEMICVNVRIQSKITSVLKCYITLKLETHGCHGSEGLWWDEWHCPLEEVPVSALASHLYIYPSQLSDATAEGIPFSGAG